MEQLLNYFPNLTPLQQEQFAQMGNLYRAWNEKINVISRKDIDHLYEHHILHALAIAKFINFKPGAQILDLGTGGGLPGLPLAIYFPETQFTLIDGTRKKITVVEEISKALDLPNVTARQIRAEELKARFDFVVSRAVASLDRLVEWTAPLIQHREQHALPNGLIALKGGDIKTEIKAIGRGVYTESHPLSAYYKEAYFQEKYVVYVQH